MALDATALEETLKETLKTELDTILGAAPNDGDTHRQEFCDAIAKAVSTDVVAHIIDNLEVKGVTVEIPGTTVVTTPGGPTAVGIPNPNPITLTQSNDGTGRVE